MMTPPRGRRYDLIALALVALTLVTAAAIRAGKPAPAVTGDPLLGPVATVTPTLVPTVGWWGAVDLATPQLRRLPSLPRPQLSGQRGGSSYQAGALVKYDIVSCPTEGVRVSRVLTGQPGWFNFYGSVRLAGLAYWKGELSADGAHWTLLYRSPVPVNDGLLIEFHTGTVPPGDYQLRIMAVDGTGNYPPPCVIRLTTR